MTESTQTLDLRGLIRRGIDAGDIAAQHEFRSQIDATYEVNDIDEIVQQALAAASMVWRDDFRLMLDALQEIAAGEGVYGAQAWEYKSRARKALADLVKRSNGQSIRGGRDRS